MSRFSSIRWRPALLWGLAVLVLGNLGVLAYAAWPSSAEAPPLGQPPLASSRLVLVVHGLGDSADAWPSKVTGAMSAARPSEQGWLLHAYDWNPHSRNALRAASHARAIGAALGRQLAASTELEELHLVAHSVGSFLIHALCQSLRESVAGQSGRVAPQIHATYLDAFAMAGAHDWSYGNREFGNCADTSDAYLNTDDPAVSTNDALANSLNYDVTAAAGKGESELEPHWWPVAFYEEMWRRSRGAPPLPGTQAGFDALRGDMRVLGSPLL